jgi:hypothetical protein
MSDLDFYPAPAPSGRSILRWLILFTHAVLFGVFIYAYPSLSDSIDGLNSNLARMAILVWGGTLVLHVVLITLWDIIEGFIHKRKRRAEIGEYRRMRNRQKLINQLTNAIDIDQATKEE